MNNITVLVAFLAGLVSFLSPCVLPIVPGFLSYLAGSSLNDSGKNRWVIFLNSLFFVVGFSSIFAILGVLLNTLFSDIAYDLQLWLSRLGGIIIIFFGIYLLGLFHIPWLEQEHKLEVKYKFNSQYLTSFTFGAAFAVGWTPCVGAVLGGIYALALSQPGSAFALLFAYSLGLGLPFLVVGLFTSQASAYIRKYAGVLNIIKVVFGVILIALGILVFTQKLSLIANFELLNSLILK